MANTFNVTVYIEHGFEDSDAFTSWLELLIRGEMARSGWIGDSSVSQYVDTDGMDTPDAAAPAADMAAGVAMPDMAAMPPQTPPAPPVAPVPDPAAPAAPEPVTEPYAPAPQTDTPPGTADLPPAA